MAAALECVKLSKIYGASRLAAPAIEDVTLALDRGQACALIGPSGSGKTTLLSILGCLLSPSGGVLRIEGQVVDHASSRVLCGFRRAKIGFVFQHSHLLPFLSVRQNLRAVGKNARMTAAELNDRIAELLVRLQVHRIADAHPERISGGERQRVAIARALIHRPPIILADEPTAALDWQNGESVIRLLTEQTRIEKAVLLTVTHDTRLLAFFDRVFHIDDGKINEK